jgi:excisionase family DNA binding protein
VPKVTHYENSSPPQFVTVREAMRMVPTGHSKFYELLAEGKMRAVKHGRRTLIEVASIRRYLEALPSAKFARPRDSRRST